LIVCYVCGTVLLRTVEFVWNKSVTLIYVRVRGAPKKIFGWLRNITNSTGIRLAAKKFGGGVAQVNKIWRGGARRRRRGLYEYSSKLNCLSSHCISYRYIYSQFGELLSLSSVNDVKAALAQAHHIM